MAAAERKKSVRDPLMVAASEYAKARKKLSALSAQYHKAKIRTGELADAVRAQEKVVDECDKALRGAPLTITVTNGTP
jgi:hypothetical protein